MDDRSILEDIKKLLGLEPEFDAFDQDIQIHINSAFSVLHQLGVGPLIPYFISDNTNKWSEFLEGRLDLNNVRTYIYQQVRLVFDPPTNPSVLTSLEKQIQEGAWRLAATAERIPNA